MSTEINNAVDKFFTMVLWKLQGRNEVVLTEDDVTKFVEEFNIAQGGNPQLVMHGTKDGFVFRVMADEEYKKFIEDYRASGKGFVFGD